MKVFQFCRAAFFCVHLVLAFGKGFRIGRVDKNPVSKFIPVLVNFCEARI